ncbi:Shedu immune nuclease family protein [Pseudonocardia humida]|uniref:DUF4263 domain-containing protein n=1 Tax=Pseudonocardia humida TaxID=2800819 RepID=A0ABT1A7A7_9PSEU|nr:Shedu immune nuclease family protein [Pseudonocardia humida]MCO1658903.1 DUF4263 domain-containing protein [Pseudonocardia humida]
MDAGSDTALAKINTALASVDLAAPNPAHHREFERVIAELTGFDPRQIYASTISKAGNFTVRAVQSKRAQEAVLFVGIVPERRHLGATQRSAFGFVKNGRTTAVLLIVRDKGYWRPEWGAEGSPSASTPLRILSKLVPISIDEVTPDTPHIVDLRRAYESDPERFRQLIEGDPAANDVVAIAHRNKVVERFRLLLEDDAEFEAAAHAAGGPEAVWQQFLEASPWVLGVSLTGQLLTSWDATRLEQVVAGFSIAGSGKRTDALLRTSGSIRSLVFAEIKHHKTPLLSGTPYRPGCWAPSSHLAGAIAQVQQTVAAASRDMKDALPDIDTEGADTGETTFLIRPRSFLILGHLDQLRGDRGVHRPQLRSFELFRRNLYEPEIITFDELLARAEWHVALAETSSSH